MFTSPKSFSDGSSKELLDKKQLRRDRIEAIIVLIVTLALFALAFWAASFGNGAGESINEYWHMMP